MSDNNNGIVVAAIAGADLSASKGLIVYFDGADSEKIKVAGAAANATTLGVLVGEAADDAVCRVQLTGLAQGKAGGAIEPFDLVTSNASGEFVVAGTQDDYILGRYVSPVSSSATRDAADGDEILVLLFDDKRTQVP